MKKENRERIQKGSALLLPLWFLVFSAIVFAESPRDVLQQDSLTQTAVPDTFRSLKKNVVQKMQQLNDPQNEIQPEKPLIAQNRLQSQVPEKPAPWDVNGDFVVDVFDLVIVGKEFGKAGDNRADVNGDKMVNIFDLVLVGSHFGEKIPQKQEFVPLAEVEALLPKLDSFNENISLPAARQIAQWFQEGKLDEKSIKLVQQKAKELIKELTNPDPRNTKLGRAYPIIENLGQIATQPLIDNTFDLGANTDSRKWSLELLGHAGKFEEVFNVLLQVIDGDPKFEWWHRAEATNGMQALLERQSKDRLFELKSHPNSVVSSCRNIKFTFIHLGLNV